LCTGAIGKLGWIGKETVYGQAGRRGGEDLRSMRRGGSRGKSKIRNQESFRVLTRGI